MQVPFSIDDTWYERTPELPERISAGGVVVRIDGGGLLVALVRERDEYGRELPGYVLPKGRVDPGEDIATTAIREIQEEAGLSALEALGELAVLEHQDLNREWWAICHYGLYYTTQISGEILDVDHHFDFGWFPLEALPEIFWPCEREMLHRERHRIYDMVISRQNPKPRKRGFM